MKNKKNIYLLVITALLIAFTCIATMAIQVPTPPTGYIHLGDALVILSGILLGPVLGGFAAGFGSMLADLLSGYVLYAIPTLIIKGVAAMIAGYAFHKLRKSFILKRTSNLIARNSLDHSKKPFHLASFIACIIAGLLCELNVVLGYFINSCISPMVLTSSYNNATFTAGITDGLLGIPLNCIQGGTGILLATLLLPLLMKIPDVRNNAYHK